MAVPPAPVVNPDFAKTTPKRRLIPARRKPEALPEPPSGCTCKPPEPLDYGLIAREVASRMPEPMQGPMGPKGEDGISPTVDVEGIADQIRAELTGHFEIEIP